MIMNINAQLGFLLFFFNLLSNFNWEQSCRQGQNSYCTETSSVPQVLKHANTIGAVVSSLAFYPGDLGSFSGSGIHCSLCAQHSTQFKDLYRFVHPICIQICTSHMHKRCKTTGQVAGCNQADRIIKTTEWVTCTKFQNN